MGGTKALRDREGKAKAVGKGALMASSVTILVRGCLDIDALVGRLADFTGARFTALEGPGHRVYQATVLCTDIRVFPAAFEDDQGLPLASFEYAVDSQSVGRLLEHGEAQAWLRAFSVLLARSLAHTAGWRCLVLEDMQKLILHCSSNRADRAGVADNSEYEWSSLVAACSWLLEAEQRYAAARRLLLAREDRVRIVREAMRGSAWKVALMVLDGLEPEELRELLPELILRASTAHGALDLVRRYILALPREWLLAGIEKEAEPYLASGTYDEYRRFLELYSQLDAALTTRLAQRAAAHADSDIREAGLEYLQG